MTASELALLPDTARRDFKHWRRLIEPLLGLERGVTRALKELAAKSGEPLPTIRRKYYAAKKDGLRALVDRRLLGPAAWETREDIGLPEPDKQLVKTYCENNQRSSETAIDELLRDWRRGKVFTSTPIDPRTGYPRGWSKRNLYRYAPTKKELKAARIGRTAARSESRLVYTTRAHLQVGQFYMFDDMWHDHEVVHLDQRKRGRPLEFHALDLFSACKFAWGMRVRVPNEETGRMEQLKGGDMRFLLAMVLGSHGYNATTGTTLVVEHGTAAIEEELERLLYDETGGLIRVARSGMEGAAAAAHQYAGRAKGNFKIKAALESLGNLIHNEFGALPGQVGKDRNHSPEQLWGIQRTTDALLKAVAQLPPERIEMLRWPILTHQQFLAIAGEIYARINARTEHDLEGWDALYVPDRQTGLMRRMSPAEVWGRGRLGLTRLQPAATAMILARDCGTERTVRRGMVELTDGEISGDVLRFSAHAIGLPDGEKYLTILNPYAPDALHCFDAKGRFVGSAPRIYSIDRAATDAIMAECGRAEKEFAQRLQPFRARHAAEAREKAARARHNARVLAGEPVTREEKATSRALRDYREAAADLAAPASEDFDAAPEDDAPSRDVRDLL